MRDSRVGAVLMSDVDRGLSRHFQRPATRCAEYLRREKVLVRRAC
jgi:hypothetical protein